MDHPFGFGSNGDITCLYSIRKRINWLRSLRLDDDIFGKGLESHSARLHYRNGNMTCFPGLDVSYDAGFACMCSADDIALSAVYQLARWFGFHRYCSIVF